METAKKKPRGKPFTGADDPRLRQNMQAPREAEPEEEVEGYEVDELTTAERMRKVFSQPKAKDRGPAEKLLRQLIESDLDKYLSRMTAAERAESGRAGGGTVGRGTGTHTASDPLPLDAGSQQACDALSRWLECWHQQNSSGAK
jgi:hypothetical protein